MGQYDEQLDSWLEQVSKVPLVRNMSQLDQERVWLIDSLVLQLAVEGYDKLPREWTTEMLADLFFNRFVRLLDEDEKQLRLFELIPTAMTVLLNVLQVPQSTKLLNWVKGHHDQLTHLYDPVADEFYSQLDQAMKLANIDMNDSAAVSQFTRDYLRQHPNQSRALFEEGDHHEK